MKNKSLIILLLAAFSFAACKKEPGNAPGTGGPGTEVEGTAKLTLKIRQASGLTTYAGGDPNATVEEISVNRIDVFIFDDGAPYGLTHRFFDQAIDIYNDPLDPEAGIKTLELDAVKTGTKRIYVALNLTTAVVDRLVQNYSYLTDGITFNAGTEAPYNTDQLFEHLVFPADIGVSNDSRMVMFNTYDFDHATDDNVVTIIDGVNPAISVNVSRMVAKAAVKLNAAGVVNIPGGTLSDLRYTAGQTNNRLHLAPLRDFVDANWAVFESTDFNPNAIDEGFQPYANAAVPGTAFGDFEDAGTPKIYIPENTSQNHQHNEVSYISLRAVFTPYDDGEPDGFGSTPTVTGAFPAGTFHAVFSNDVSSSGDPIPGVAVHFWPDADEAAADAYALAHDGIKLTYEDGFCYYRIYLNPNGDGATTGNPYDILRNVFYKVNITKINTIGTVDPDHIPGALGTPGFPGGTVVTELAAAVLPTDQIDPPVNADIETTVTIEDWTDAPDDYEF